MKLNFSFSPVYDEVYFKFQFIEEKNSQKQYSTSYGTQFEYGKFRLTNKTNKEENIAKFLFVSGKSELKSNISIFSE